MTRQDIENGKRYITKFHEDINEEKCIIMSSIISNPAKNANEKHEFVIKSHYNQFEVLLCGKKLALMLYIYQIRVCINISYLLEMI